MTKKLTRGFEKRKPGRPFIPEEEKKKYARVSLNLPEDVHAALTNAAKETRRTVTGYIIYAIEKTMEADK